MGRIKRKYFFLSYNDNISEVNCYIDKIQSYSIKKIKKSQNPDSNLAGS